MRVGGGWGKCPPDSELLLNTCNVQKALASVTTPGIENAETGPTAEIPLELLRRKAWTAWQLQNDSGLTVALWGSGPQSLAAESSGRLGNTDCWALVFLIQ